MKRNILPIDKMLEIEEWIEDNYELIIGEAVPDKNLLKKLNLKLEYVSQDNFGPNTEAELRPCEDGEHFGLIRVNNKHINTRFAYVHEIIHYLKDVGLGNKVTKVYTRKTKGNTIDLHEQEVNYATAAAILKYQDMKDLILSYDRSKPKMDELELVHKICDNYGQERTTVIRRIQEVRILMKKRMPKY